MSSQPAKNKQKRKSYHRGNVRDDLIFAAEQIIEVEGLSAITLRRLTREIGVTPANFYNHFESLDYLLAAMAEDGFRQLEGRLRRGSSRISTSRARFIKICREYIYFAMDNAQLFSMMFSFSTDDSQHQDLTQAGDRLFGVCVEVLYGENFFSSKDGYKSFQEVPHAFSSWSTLHGMALIILSGGVKFETGSRREVTSFIDGAFEALIEGVGVQLEKVST